MTLRPWYNQVVAIWFENPEVVYAFDDGASFTIKDRTKVKIRCRHCGAATCGVFYLDSSEGTVWRETFTCERCGRSFECPVADVKSAAVAAARAGDRVAEI